jgi:hypothetical protein
LARPEAVIGAVEGAERVDAPLITLGQTGCVPTGPVLVVDAGTTAVKAALLGPGGAALATVSVEQPVQHPGLADAHGELWALLRPTFRALAGP